MKKVFSLFFAAIAFMFIYSSCKKTQHPTNPTPANYRLLSYTRFLSGAYVNPHTDNFTFSYDSKNRVTQIIASTNDTAPVQTGFIGERALFFYSNDTIYRVVTKIRVATDTVEMDTFIHNSSNQIITAYLPGKHYVNYEYYGKLLARVTDNYYAGNTSVAALRTYTSDNSDLLALNYDGKLTASFGSYLTVPMGVDWTTISPAGATTSHITNVNSDVFTNSAILGTLWPVSVTVADNESHTETCLFPASYVSKESYGVYPDKADRIGDVMQLSSFTFFGINIYQNAHMNKTIATTGHNTYTTYDIDADSKVKTATSVTTDSLGAITTTIYTLQYETN